jgi:hypothetical protein
MSEKAEQPKGRRNTIMSTHQTLGIANPGLVLSKAWAYFSDLDDTRHEMSVKQASQGLTRSERKKFKVLGAACVAANQVVDALIDARDGVFNAPQAYAL